MNLITGNYNPLPYCSKLTETLGFNSMYRYQVSLNVGGWEKPVYTVDKVKLVMNLNTIYTLRIFLDTPFFHFTR